MASKPIPALGVRAFRLLTAAYTEKKAALDAQYVADCQAVGDEILEAMGENPHDPSLTVNYDEGVVTGFSDPDVEQLIQQTIVALREQRAADGVPPDGTIVEAAPTPEPVPEPVVATG